MKLILPRLFTTGLNLKVNYQYVFFSLWPFDNVSVSLREFKSSTTTLYVWNNLDLCVSFDLNSFFHSTSKHAASSSQVILIIELKIVAITSIYTARLLQLLKIGVITKVDVFLTSCERHTNDLKFLITDWYLFQLRSGVKCIKV